MSGALRNLARGVKNRLLAPLLVVAAERFGFNYALRSPDRDFLEQQIFGRLLHEPRYRRILFAGVEIYTCHYPKFFPGRDFRTIDWDAAKSSYGRRGFHQVGSVCELQKYYAPRQFDAVLFNGLIGYGLNSMAAVDLALSAAHAVLDDEGVLILGWNDTAEHLDFALDALPAYKLFSPFAPASLGLATNWVAMGGSNRHTYDFLIKSVPAAAQPADRSSPPRT